MPRFDRGRLVGYVQRDDLSGAMARLARLDRLAGRPESDPVRAAELRRTSERLGPLFGEN